MSHHQQQDEPRQERQPGIEGEMRTAPEFAPRHPGSGKLEGRVAIVTGGDSGIGRAVAVAMAREGASICVVYKDEHEDAQEACRLIREEGREALAHPCDVGEEEACRAAVQAALDAFGRIDVLVNNAAEQHVAPSLIDISADQLERTFRTNVYGPFFMTKAALPHLKPGASIINTTSVTAFKGSEELIDYSATRGAIVAFTRSLSQALAADGVRVNAVAPGPIWTPLIVASFDEERIASHGQSSPMKRAGQPNEVAPCYVFLASDDASYMTGQILHPNGGAIVGA